MVLGPSEAPLAVLRGRHRFRLLVQAPRAVDLQGFLRDWLADAPPVRGSLKVQVDIDPQSWRDIRAAAVAAGVADDAIDRLVG